MERGNFPVLQVMCRIDCQQRKDKPSLTPEPIVVSSLRLQSWRMILYSQHKASIRALLSAKCVRLVFSVPSLFFSLTFSGECNHPDSFILTSCTSDDKSLFCKYEEIQTSIQYLAAVSLLLFVFAMLSGTIHLFVC